MALSLKLSVILLGFVLLQFTERAPGARYTTPRHRKVWTNIFCRLLPWKEHKATVIFLHPIGFEGTAVKIIMLLKTYHYGFHFDNVKVIFYESARAPYGPLMGADFNVWMDESGRGSRYKEILDETYQISVQGLKKAVQDELQMNPNITMDKIIIGGYVNGGKMALHMGYRFLHDIAGVFAFSAVLPNDSIVFKDLEEKKPAKLPRLFYANSLRDRYVTTSEHKITLQRLQSYGVNATFKTFETMDEWVVREQLLDLQNWIYDVLGMY